jgi:copper homeostasis protein
VTRLDDPRPGTPLRKLEVCVTSLATAQAAQRGGADRVELCVDLACGGVTPPDALLTSVVQALSIPVHVLIRPRAGSFVYSAEELARMRRQIELARSIGAAAVVLGVLKPDHNVDIATTRSLIELARPLRVTFHRAFDETPNRSQALQHVIATGADCLLTSGGAPDVLNGTTELTRLREQAAGRIEIMPGGGLRLDNLAEVARRTAAQYLHGSFTWADPTDKAAPEAELIERRVREAVSLLRSLYVVHPVVE